MNIQKKVIYSVIAIYSLFYLTSYTFAKEFEISIQNVKYPVSQICFDNGFIRPIQTPATSESVIQLEVLKLPRDRRTYRYRFIPSQGIHYNRDKKRYENYSIDPCSQNLITRDLALDPKVMEPSTAEEIFYGNLLNNNINHIVQEDWKKYKGLNDYIRYHGEKEQIKLAYDFEFSYRRSDFSRYEDWKTNSLSLGGEQSGGGSLSKASLRLNISSEDFKRFNKKRSFLEDFFDVQNTYYRVLEKEEPLPFALMFVTKEDLD